MWLRWWQKGDDFRQSSCYFMFSGGMYSLRWVLTGQWTEYFPWWKRTKRFALQAVFCYFIEWLWQQHSCLLGYEKAGGIININENFPCFLLSSLILRKDVGSRSFSRLGIIYSCFFFFFVYHPFPSFFYSILSHFCGSFSLSFYFFLNWLFALHYNSFFTVLKLRLEEKRP